MSYWQQYKSPFGYTNGGNKIDRYGVNHSGFSTRDELEYQTVRTNRENDLLSRMKEQGITDYPQYTTNFWGSSADNNYGFGTSDISRNIENMKNMTPQSHTSTSSNTPQPERSVWNKFKQYGNNFADATQAGVVGYATGTALGNFDEAMGTATAVFSGNTDKYKMGRDATRQLQNNLKGRHPYIYNIAETIGAATTPMHLFKASKTAPLARHQANRLYNGIMDTGIAAVGYSDLSDPWDILKNAGTIGLGNTLGNYWGTRMLGRGVGNASRIGFNIAGSALSNTATDWFSNKTE